MGEARFDAEVGVCDLKTLGKADDVAYDNMA
jgi:hypothetical protein